MSQAHVQLNLNRIPRTQLHGSVCFSALLTANVEIIINFQYAWKSCIMPVLLRVAWFNPDMFYHQPARQKARTSSRGFSSSLLGCRVLSWRASPQARGRTCKHKKEMTFLGVLDILLFATWSTWLNIFHHQGFVLGANSIAREKK